MPNLLQGHKTVQFVQSSDPETAPCRAFEADGKNSIMHFVKPQMIAWSDLIHDAVEALGSGASFVKYERWLHIPIAFQERIQEPVKPLVY